MDQRLVLRVVINEEDIRKLTLSGKPDSVEALQVQLKEKLALLYNFNLQYEDPDFNNALCNLTDISDLPEKATLNSSFDPTFNTWYINTRNVRH